jgi:hypothetical protein
MTFRISVVLTQAEAESSCYHLHLSQWVKSRIALPARRPI